MKLIGTHASPYTRKVRVVAAEKKIDLAFEVDNPWLGESGVPGHNPLGKVPVLMLDDGSPLFDSRVIVEYLDSASPVAKLIPHDHRARAEIRRWEALADGVLDAGVAMRLENQRDPAQRSDAWLARQREKVDRALGQANRELGNKKWIEGPQLTLADIALGTCVLWLEFRLPSIEWRRTTPNLARLANQLSERPSFAETVPKE